MSQQLQFTLKKVSPGRESNLSFQTDAAASDLPPNSGSSSNRIDEESLGVKIDKVENEMTSLLVAIATKFF